MEEEGILLDVFTTSYMFNKEDSKADMLEQVRILEFPFFIGFYMVRALVDHSPFLKLCIEQQSKQKSGRDIYSTLLKYLQGPTVRVSYLIINK